LRKISASKLAFAGNRRRRHACVAATAVAGKREFARRDFPQIPRFS